MEEKDVQVEEVVKVRHIVCGYCGVVTELPKWKEILNDFNNEQTDLECSNCECINFHPTLAIDEDEAHWQEVPVTFTEAEIQKLSELKEQKKEIEKEEKQLSSKVKEALVPHNVKKFGFAGVSLEVSYQDRSTMDDEKLVGIIESKLTEKEIEEKAVFKKVTNPDAVKQLLNDGIITMDELISCKVPNIITVLNVKKPKKAKTSPNPFF